MAADRRAGRRRRGDRSSGRRLEELIERLGRIEEAESRLAAEELVAAVIGVYGEGLERILEILEESGEQGAELRQRLADDGVVASLLLIHDLYPVDLETRVAAALDKVRPYMESHGGNVELLGLEEGVARIRLEGSCRGCAASSATLELAIKQALEDEAPDLEGLEVEGAIEEIPPQPPSGLELPVLQVDGNGAPPAAAPRRPPTRRSRAGRRSRGWRISATASCGPSARRAPS